MARLLSIVILILVVVLFPPAALALVSNNAVPGDATYPIKRGLEDVIYTVASLNPNTKAMFAKARSDRRFQEITVLLTQGKQASQTLNELVEQTQTAADQINQVSDLNARKQMIKKLQDSITKYDQGLSKVSQTKTKEEPLSPSATIAPKPVATPGPTTTPAPNPPSNDIYKTLAELERIRRELELQRQELMRMQNQSLIQTSSPQPTLRPTSTPSSTPTPSLTPTPSQHPTPKPGVVRIQSVDEGMIQQLDTTAPENISSGSSQTEPSE